MDKSFEFLYHRFLLLLPHLACSKHRHWWQHFCYIHSVLFNIAVTQSLVYEIAGVGFFQLFGINNVSQLLLSFFGYKLLPFVKYVDVCIGLDGLDETIDNIFLLAQVWA